MIFDSYQTRFAILFVLFNVTSSFAINLCPSFYAHPSTEIRTHFYRMVYSERNRNYKIFGAMRISRKRSLALSSYLKQSPISAPIVQDPWTVPQVLRNLQRLKFDEHTLNVEEYVNRHLSPELMETLIQNESIKIDVFAGTLENAYGHLKYQGFDLIEVLPARWVTDYVTLVAYNHTKNEFRFLINTLNGVSYPKEAVAQILYYRAKGVKKGKPSAINPSRLSVFRDGRSPSQIFNEILLKEKIDPDVVVFGYKSSLEKIAREAGIDFKENCQSRELCYSVFKFREKTVMAVNIEPHLFGDRSGELVKAVQKLSLRKRSFIFVGTAGSLDKKIPFNSYIVPTWRRQSDQDSQFQIPNNNLAVDVLNSDDPRRRLYKGRIGQIAVESILFEDKKWTETHAKEFNPHGASIVEQEGFDFFNAVEARQDHAFAVYRISDAPLEGQDFASIQQHLKSDDVLHDTQVQLLNAAIDQLGH
jgi:hypothetical protein